MIEVTPEFKSIAVRIGGVLHLWFDRSKLLGVQSWVTAGHPQFFIDIILEGGVISADYDTKEKWEAILSQLDALLTGRNSI